MDLTDALRESEIHALELIDRPVPDVLRHLLDVATRVTGAEGARINVVTRTRQVTLASSHGGPWNCAAEESLCAKIVREPDLLHVVPDIRADARFAETPFARSGAIVSYAASQLRTVNDVPIGTLCIYDSEERVYDARMMEVLGDLSRAAVDVLETRRHHENLRETLVQLADGQRELRRSNEHLGAFAGQVSHDVQGPLAAVLVALEMLEDEGVGREEAAGFFLRSAISGAQRMRSTINGLMDFAVLGGTLHPVWLDLRTVVEEVLADLTLRRGRAEVVVGELPKIWGDDVQIRAVTQNLVANALKYAGQVDRPRIRVEGAVVDGRARISVSDNGPGVPPDQRESIFELMVRGEDASRSDIEGLGIGLATCRRILHAHQGTLGVQDSSDGGAEFWFELPAAETVVLAG